MITNVDPYDGLVDRGQWRIVTAISGGRPVVAFCAEAERADDESFLANEADTHCQPFVDSATRMPLASRNMTVREATLEERIRWRPRGRYAKHPESWVEYLVDCRYPD